MTGELDGLRAWIGREETRREVLAPAPLVRAAATLDRDDPPPADGDPIPPGWHWFYFLPSAPQSEIGDDGHPRRGGFLPPVPLPQRMWAGGRMTFARPLAVGEPATRRSEIIKVEPKSGRSGRLVFVTVRHTVSGAAGPATIEEHDIVYREQARPGAAAAPPAPAPARADWSRTVAPDPVLLFRFSALTFNGHRIHYDRPYCETEAGYPGLVVHGPLSFILLLDLVRRELPDATVAGVDYRMMRPLFDVHRFTVNGARAEDGTLDLWAADHEAALATRAAVALAEGDGRSQK